MFPPPRDLSRDHPESSRGHGSSVWITNSFPTSVRFPSMPWSDPASRSVIWRTLLMMQIAWTSQKTRISPQTVPRKKALPKTMMWKKTLTSENGRTRERGDVTDLRVGALAFSRGWCYNLRILRCSCSHVVVQGASEE
jgi:hypothetical protein